MFERLFKLSEHGTSVRTEVVAGVTTFLTMSYIIFVNPDILSTTGMDRDAVFVATCLAAALGSLVMALVANWPIGMAPGMGLNAFFAFTVVAALGFSWQQALGAVFISGCLFLLAATCACSGSLYACAGFCSACCQKDLLSGGPVCPPRTKGPAIFVSND